jgi:hypothetical protein
MSGSAVPNGELSNAIYVKPPTLDLLFLSPPLGLGQYWHQCHL